MLKKTDHTGVEPGLTHFDSAGGARMVDVSGKESTIRVAEARGEIAMAKETLDLVKAGRMGKGDVLGVARIAAIMAAKNTGGLIPLCHPLPLSSVNVEFRFCEEAARIEVRAGVKTAAPTGVEMEALTAVSVALLTIYDMCKAVDKNMVLGSIRLVEKLGGKSGHYKRAGEARWEE
jgi:cyclic pyranopterin phosphate synthase